MRCLSRRRFLGTLGASSILTAGTARAAGTDSYVLRLSVTLDANSAIGLAAIRLASAVNRRSQGRLKIEVYPNGQIAKESESVQDLTTGVLDLSIQATPFVESLFPRFAAFDLPFLFRDLNAASRVLDGPIGDEFLAELPSKGIVGLAWGAGGFKELETTTKPIVVPDDMHGLRMRIPNGAVYVATYQALGAIPLAIDFSETYSALSQHTIDGMDVNLDVATTGKYYTVVKHVAMSHHIFSGHLILGSKRSFDALPRPLQQILQEESRKVVPYWRALFSRQVDEDIEILKKNGVAFTAIQYPLFRKAVDPVYATFGAKLGAGLIDRISRAAV